MSRNRKSARKNSQRTSHNDYQQLEPRQMLTVDLGIGFTPSTFDPTAPFDAPNISGDIGPNHIIQIINGEYTLFNTVGAQISQSTVQSFFGTLAGADLQIGTDNLNNPILGQVQDARVVFDHDTDRWFVSGILAQEDGSNLPGNDILLAVSRTANPIDGFQSVQFVGDSTGQHFNSFATLAVNGDNVVITTNNEIDPLNTSVSVYAIAKADLVGFAPSAIDLARFENLNPNLFGTTIQFATDLNGDSGSTIGLATFESGTTLSLVELNNVGDPVNAATITRTVVNVPFYEAAPDGRQPNDVAPLNNISPEITGNVVSQGGFLWTVHSIEGSDNNSAVRWYQISEATGEVVNTGDIDDPTLDFLYPSIAVNEFGVIAIGFTGSGSAPAQNPSAFVSTGFSTIGLDATPTVTFPQAPAIVQEGVDNLVNITDGINPFGEYSATRIDPDDPFSFYTFQEFVAGDDIWGTSVSEFGITDIQAVINADSSNNVVLIRRSAQNNDWLEIVIDGTVTDTFELDALDSIELNLMEGDDLIVIDESTGLISTDLGFTINAGDGNDTLTVIDTNGHLFEITGDGSGTLDTINTFTGFEVIFGSGGDDVFIASNSTTDWILNGNAGNDEFEITNTASGEYVLNGGSGDDTYRLPLANFASIEVNDSEGLNDSLVGLGTTGNDELVVNNSTLIFNGVDVSIFGFDEIEALDFDGIEGDDTFQIQAIDADANFSGGAGDDTFNISSNAPDSSGVTISIQGALNIDGGTGSNRIDISNSNGIPSFITLTSNQIQGFTTDPITFTGSFGTGADGLAGIILTGSDLAGDLFEIQSVLATNSVLAQGGQGEDIFTVRNTTVGQVFLDGQLGADTFRTSFGNSNRNVTVNDTGSDNGLDRFSIRTNGDADDVLTINNNNLLGVSGEQFAWTGVENLIFDVGVGNDTITVGNNQTTAIRVILDEGDDTAIITGTSGLSSVRFDGNAGNDQFQFENSVAETFVLGLGGEGNDTFDVSGLSFARGRVDGQAGNDIANIEFAARDSRRINARDTGDGTDLLNIIGTPAADRLDLFTQIVDREGELIVYDENTESIDLNLFGSNDIVNVFGTAAADFEANLGVGNDILNVISTASPAAEIEFSFELSAGNDIANVTRVSETARVEIFGQSGDDNFNVGSTRDEDDGNLNGIRGELFIGGGANNPGIDSLQINDRGTGAAPFNYTISATSFANASGAFTRPFESFNFNDIEFVFASGNDGQNQFTVTPGQNTIIRVDGNNNPAFGDSLVVNVAPSVAQRFGGDTTGFFAFSNGLSNVSFQEVESTSTSNGAGAFTFDPSVFDEVDSLAARDKIVSEELVDLFVDFDFIG